MIPSLHHALLLFCPILLLFFPSVQPLSAQEPEEPENKALNDLWIDMSIGPPIVPIFNDVARSEDMARVMHPDQISQLDGIINGRKLVIFKSIPETEQYLPGLADQIDVIGYNLEHGPATPISEQNDPVGSIQQMRALADAHGKVLAFGPDHDFALSHGVQIAPYVDIFVLQIQRQQSNHDVVREFVEPLVPQLRAANPEIQVSVQVRTEGDVPALIALLNSLIDHLDGISILTSPDTVDIAQELVNALRPIPTAVTLASTPFAHPPSPDQFQTIRLAAFTLLILITAIFLPRRTTSK